MYYKFTISEGEKTEVIEVEANCHAQAWEFVMAQYDPFN